MATENDSSRPKFDDKEKTRVEGELFDVLTLLVASQQQREIDDTSNYDDSLTSRESRADSLMFMAQDKVRQLIERVDRIKAEVMEGSQQ